MLYTARVIVLATVAAVASHPSSAQATRELQGRVSDLENQLSDSKREIEELRQQLQELKKKVDSASANPTDSSMFPTQSTTELQAPPAEGQDRIDELTARVEEQAQSKVESGSRYRVRLHGMILANTYLNTDQVDVSDLPNLAFGSTPGAPRGDIGTTLRQTMLGLQVTGPNVFGARASADFEADFFGGFPTANYGVTAGLFRLRTARASLDWKNTTVVVGQDVPFFSPLSPTSYATVGEPALSWSGNLWVWTPQVRVERRWAMSEDSHFFVQGGLLDALTEQIPPSQFNRVPTPGEQSRKPAIATHLGWAGKLFGQAAGIGAGSFYSRQSYGFNRNVDAWAVTGDWNIPLGGVVSLSGEFFRGRALGGLGGGIWNSVVYDGSPGLSANRVVGLNTMGGWSQLKFKPVVKWEFNLAAGTDNPFASDLRRFSKPTGAYFPPLARNQTLLGNVVYRPVSNLLFSAEYRKLRTYSLATRNEANHINLAVGVAF